MFLSFAVHTLRRAVSSLSSFLLLHKEQIWRTKWTPKIQKLHSPGHHLVLALVIGLGAFALPLPRLAAEQLARFSMIISNGIETP